jgi:hypothetical protein
MKAFLIGALLSLPVAFAQGQTCLKSVNLSSVCGSMQARVASGVCLNGSSKVVGSASGSCMSATSITNQLNNLCNSSGSCSVQPPPSPPPPPSSFNLTIRSIYKTKVNGSGVAQLEFQHYYRDLYWCMDLLNIHRVSLSTSDSRNASLLSVEPASQWMYVNLVCPSNVGYSQDQNTGTKTYTYPSGCYVSSYGPSSPPSPPNAYCY